MFFGIDSRSFSCRPCFFITSFIVLIVFFSALSSAFISSNQEPILISTCEDLQNISQNLGGNYRLASDINCSDTRSWNNGSGFKPIENFSGTLDGGNYTIFNLYINNDSKQGNTALFSSTTSGAVIQNLILADVDVKSNSTGGRTASLVAVSYASQISNVRVAGSIIVSGGCPAAGLVAHNGGGRIRNSSFVGTISAEAGCLGGLVAVNDLNKEGNPGEIVDSFADVDIKSGGDRVAGLVSTNYGVINGSCAIGSVSGRAGVGGLVGVNALRSSNISSGGIILNNYAAVDVSGSFYVGGLVGSTSGGNIECSYAAGRVNGASDTGGLIGIMDGATSVSNSCYDLDISGQSDLGKGVPKTTSEMMQKNTFSEWDFESVWKLEEELDYPKLDWQKIELKLRFGSIDSPQRVNTSFPLSILANTHDFNDKVYLYSDRLSISPSYVQMESGKWTGKVNVFSIGERNYLIARWNNQVRKDSETSTSNEFDVANEEGEMPKDATLMGTVTNDDENPVVGATVSLYSENPRKNYFADPEYVTNTDTGGKYVFENIIPGKFYLQIQQSCCYQDKVQEIDLASKRTITGNIEINPICGSNTTSIDNGKVPVLLVPGIMGSREDEWFPGIYPKLPKESPSYDSGELVLHGNWFWLAGWNKVRKEFKKKGYKKGCTLFDVPYDWSRSIEDIRDLYLVPWIKKVKRETGSKKVDIVAHSMGGLVARVYVQSYDYMNDVRKLVMAATPNEGSAGVYYICEGGDPKTADNFGGLVDFSIKFYTNTLCDLYMTRKGAWQIKCSDILDNKEDVYDFVHFYVPSAMQLMPVYDNALLHDGQCVPIKKEENMLIKALNGMECFNEKRCVDFQGNLYSFKKPDEVLTNDNSGVQTKLFAGVQEATLESIRVNTNTGTGKLYQDGVPTGKVETTLFGDGTAMARSVAFRDCFPEGKALNIDASKKADHSKVVKEYIVEIVDFITGSSSASDYPDLDYQEEPQNVTKELMVNIDGRIQASAVGPDGQSLGERFLAIDNSNVMIENPESGKYNFSLYSPYEESYGIEVIYFDSGNDSFVEKTILGHYDNGLTSFILDINGNSVEQPVVFDRVFDAPAYLKKCNNGGKVYLAWNVTRDTSQDIDHYEVFWKKDYEPYLKFLSRANQTNYLTGHDWQDAGINVYVVRERLISCPCTFFSDPADFGACASLVKTSKSAAGSGMCWYRCQFFATCDIEDEMNYEDFYEYGITNEECADRAKSGESHFGVLWCNVYAWPEW